jgi:hypothetical protein
MESYNLAYRLFHISIFVLLVIAYALLEYYIIPDFVEEKKKELASSYTGYAFWIATSLLTVGSMIAEYIDKQSAVKPQTIKSARR